VSRRIIINLVAFAALAVGMTYWAFTNLLNVHPLAHQTRVSAEFSDAAGIHTDSEVTYLGVHTGTVRAVTPTPAGVRMTILLDSGSRIPEGATAHVWRKSAIGEQYVDLAPPAGWSGAGPYLTNGAAIPQSRTSIPIEFSDLLRSATKLVGSIDPNDIATVVHELALGLQGRTDDLRSLISGGDKLASTLAARTKEIDRLLTNSETVTHVFASHAPSIEKTLADLRSVSQSLADASTDIGPLIQRGNQLLAQLVPLVQQHEGDLSCTIGGLGAVAAVSGTPAHVSGLRTALPLLPSALGNVFKATDLDKASDGSIRRWIRLGIVVNLANPPKQFVPAKPATPVVQPVPACAASPASAQTPTAALLPAPTQSGGDGLLVGLVLYAAGTAVFAVRRRAGTA
jgi:phospholipid/cholesterol/gamma-HCH transport system substrate-binding protein